MSSEIWEVGGLTSHGSTAMPWIMRKHPQAPRNEHGWHPRVDEPMRVPQPGYLPVASAVHMHAKPLPRAGAHDKLGLLPVNPTTSWLYKYYYQAERRGGWRQADAVAPGAIAQ